MNRIEKLLLDLCPNGVEFKKLGEVSKFQNGFAFKAKKFKKSGNPIIRITNIQNNVISTGEMVYFSFSDYKDVNFDNFKIKNNDILIAMSGATTGKIGIYNGDDTFYLNQRVGKFIPSSTILSKFLYHFLLTKVNFIYCLSGGGAQPNLSPEVLMKQIKIPIPPIEVQKEIAKILDTFTELEKELEKELENRKKQYEFYRDRLLSFDYLESKGGYKLMSLGEVLQYEQPTKYMVSSKEYDDEYSIPVLTAGQTFILGYTNETDGVYFASKDNPVIIFDDFTTSIQWVDFPFKIKSSAIKILRKTLESIDIRFIFHYMKTIIYCPNEHSRQWIAKYSRIQIPVPPIEVQKEIVKILDIFDSLTHSLQDGLPKEIELRKKQYEYYRNKLLSFEELECRS